MNFPSKIACIVIAFLISQTCNAQTKITDLLGGAGEKPNAELVPQSAFVGAAVFPKQITSNPALRLFPHEVVTAWGEKEIGFDPMLIKQATWIMKTPEELNADPVWAVVFHFEKMQGLAGGMIDKLEKKKIAGKTVFSGEGQRMPSFMVVDESTMVLGSESYFEEMLTSPAGSVTKLFQNGTVNGQAFAFLDMKAIEPMINEILTETDQLELAPPIERMKLIPGLIVSVELGVETKKTLESVLVFHCKNESAAEELSEILVDAMDYGKKTLLTQMGQQMDMNDPVQVATIQYTQRITEKYEKKLSPVVNGKDVTITAHEEVMTLPILASMLGSATSFSMDGPTVRMSPQNQLRQTALAFHNYTDANGKFPTRTINDDQGRPLFSGRVAMLPYMEQYNLFQQLKMDEPWDSQHNAQFTSMTIPGFGLEASGKSTLRFPVYPGSMWDEQKPATGFRDILDGTSNTIFAIHAPPEAAVNWADPTPWTISRNDPMRDIFGDRDEVTVAMLDGSTQTLKKANMTNEKLKAMLTISGGEIVNRQ